MLRYYVKEVDIINGTLGKALGGASGKAVSKFTQHTFSLNLRFDRGKNVLLIGCGR